MLQTSNSVPRKLFEFDAVGETLRRRKLEHPTIVSRALHNNCLNDGICELFESWASNVKRLWWAKESETASYSQGGHNQGRQKKKRHRVT
jgi:hypothetical protein